MQYPHSSHLPPFITTSPYNTTIALRGQRVVQKKQWPFLQNALLIANFASTALPAVSAKLPIPPATWSSFAKRVKPVFISLSSTHTSLCFLENSFENKFYCKLIFVENNTLIGFISIFPTDGEERKDLSPWYATMFVKEEYRGKGYSKILNNAILEEARRRGIQRIYLKTDLANYYEKFGAKYIENLSNGEKLYCIDIV